MEADDKKTIEDAVDEAISWLEGNREASVDELKEHKKVWNSSIALLDVFTTPWCFNKSSTLQDLESKVQPITSKLYKDAGGGAEGEEAPPTEEKDEL